MSDHKRGDNSEFEPLARAPWQGDRAARERMEKRALRRAEKRQKELHEIPLGVRRRIEGSFYLFLLPLVCFAGRAVQLQAFARSQPEGAQVDAVFTKTQTLPARRAQILAADGTALAVTLNEFNVCANPRAIKDKKKMARLLSETIGGSQDEYLAELNKTERVDGKPNFYVRLARRVDENRIDKLRARKGPQKGETRKARAIRKNFWEPITLEPTPRRHYPLGAFAPQLLGFTGVDGHGAEGLEKAWDEALAGKNGTRVSQVDSRQRPIPGFVAQWNPPTPGHAVVTTIDPAIQADADEVLNTLTKNFKPQFATAIVMRPKTGEIVAVSTSPSFDLNRKPKNVVDIASNKAFTYAYEPGSTFKIITAAAAVENVPNWQNLRFWIDGQEKIGRHLMHDWDFWSGKNKPQYKTLSDGIRDSSNITMWHFARLMGARKMHTVAERFGIAEPVDLGPVPTGRGILPKIEPVWGSAQLANISFGQGLTLTPLQLVRAVGAVANEGVMMEPRLVKELRDEQGRVVKTFAPKSIRRVIAPETAQAVTQMMVRVIKEGTARKYVWVPGYATAGKTGSAQKSDGPRGYSASKFISSLVGFVPAHKPEFVILVMADEPRGSHWGSEVCGPAFNDLANKAMLHLRLQQGANAPAPDPSLMQRPEPPRPTT